MGIVVTSYICKVTTQKGFFMHCYIQELQMKSSNSIGCGKELCVTTTNWSMNGIQYTSYGYTYSEDRFERPIKTAYKITLHGKSYRNNKGQVTKKQYHVTTIKYYDLVDFSWYDCVVNSKIDDIAEEMGIDYDLVWEEIAKKLDALQDKINAEFEQTEEYKVKETHDAILREYRVKKHDFAEKYEVQENEYDRCHDIFGKLRNKGYFEKIKRDYKARKEYEEQSRSYQKNYQSNYSYYSGSYGTGSLDSGLSTEKEKEYYKKFYRTLATKYHPDVTGDGEAMKFLNRLKESWGI